jgi:hypothetical protein
MDYGWSLADATCKGWHNKKGTQFREGWPAMPWEEMGVVWQGKEWEMAKADSGK